MNTPFWTNTTTSIDSIEIRDSTFPIEHTLTVEGRAIIQGRDVLQELDEMRDALLLLKRDVDMESKYPELAQAKQEYERILDKYKTWDALKHDCK